MAVQTISTTVGTTATQIIPAEAYAMPGSVQTIISNLGSVVVYVGPAGVTSTTGVAIAANSNLNLGTLNSQLYAVAASTTANVVVGLFS